MVNNIQYTYPFKELENLPFDIIIRQIEIEFPQSMPIELINSFTDNKLFSFKRNNKSIYNIWITDADVLEANDLKVIFDKLIAPQYKYAIVNILYENNE